MAMKHLENDEIEGSSSARNVMWDCAFLDASRSTIHR
jgi:hypothetical protein